MLFVVEDEHYHCTVLLARGLILTTSTNNTLKMNWSVVLAFQSADLTSTWMAWAGTSLKFEFIFLTYHGHDYRESTWASWINYCRSRGTTKEGQRLQMKFCWRKVRRYRLHESKWRSVEASKKHKMAELKKAFVKRSMYSVYCSKTIGDRGPKNDSPNSTSNC